MNVTLSRQAQKQLDKLNEPIKSGIEEALVNLMEEPPVGDIKKLKGNNSFRIRVGGYRIIYEITGDRIDVYKIAPRGEAYKGGKK